MRWSRYIAKLDTSPLDQAGTTATEDGPDDKEELPDGPSTPNKSPTKKTPKKQTPANKATPKKRKLNKDDGEDSVESKVKQEIDDNVSALYSLVLMIF